MILPEGAKIRVTEIQEKDYDFLDNEFKMLSKLFNGQEGNILSHNEASLEFGERESYQALIRCSDGTDRELELELDEFVSI